jgi:hypothetical protein
MRFSPALLVALAFTACDKPPEPSLAPPPAPTPAPQATPFNGFSQPARANQAGSWMWDKNRANNPLGSPAKHEGVH